LNKARASAASVACASNLRQVAMASMMYRNEYADHFVPFAQAAGQLNYWASPKGTGRWFNFLEPFTKTYDVFNCGVRDQLDRPASVRNTDDPNIAWLLRGW